MRSRDIDLQMFSVRTKVSMTTIHCVVLMVLLMLKSLHAFVVSSIVSPIRSFPIEIPLISISLKCCSPKYVFSYYTVPCLNLHFKVFVHHVSLCEIFSLLYAINLKFRDPKGATEINHSLP